VLAADSECLEALVAGRAELERELLPVLPLGTNCTLGRRPASSPPAVLRVGRRHAGMKLGLLPSRAKLGTERSGSWVLLVRGELAAEPARGVENGEGELAMAGFVLWVGLCCPLSSRVVYRRAQSDARSSATGLKTVGGERSPTFQKESSFPRDGWVLASPKQTDCHQISESSQRIYLGMQCREQSRELAYAKVTSLERATKR